MERLTPSELMLIDRTWQTKFI
eukprot:SAG22_NODE_21011_length_260_cov_1.397516_1_plen_21_part_01